MKKRGLFLRKSIDARFNELDEEEKGLRRHLKTSNLTAIGIGAIIGAGIFVITGQAAAFYAGPAVVLSFLLSGIVCALAAVCYAELASIIPFAGGAYSYSYVALGELPAWIVGWTMSAQYIFLGSAVSVGWSGYFLSFLSDFGMSIPKELCQAPLTHTPSDGWQLPGTIVNLPAMALVFLLGLLVTGGVRAASFFNYVMVFIKLASVLLFISIGLFHIDPANWTPFIPENTGTFGQFGWSGVLRGAGLVFFAYIGFDAVSTLAKDSVNPQKTLPKGILSSLAICAVAYIAVSLVLTGIVDYSRLGVADPMAVALNAMGPKFFWISFFIKIAILAGLASVVLVDILTATRIFFAMGKDKLLPSGFGEIHPKARTPLFSSITTFTCMFVIAGLLPINILGEFCSMATLLIFGIACVAVIVLRSTHPHAPRSFRVPLYPFTPIVGATACFGQLIFFSPTVWLQVISWTLIGLLIYFSFGKRNSLLRQSSTRTKSNQN